MIGELTKRSSDLQAIAVKKEKDIELTRKKIVMLREQLQAAEKILAVNELSLASFRVEKRNIDSKLANMQYQKKIQQAQLQKVLSTPLPLATQAPQSSKLPQPSLTVTPQNVSKQSLQPQAQVQNKLTVPTPQTPTPLASTVLVRKQPVSATSASNAIASSVAIRNESPKPTIKQTEGASLVESASTLNKTNQSTTIVGNSQGKTNNDIIFLYFLFLKRSLI